MGKILAIDDDKDILMLLKNTLIKDGHSVDTMSSVEDREVECFIGYDVILLDVMMPHIDGFQLCGKIRDKVDGAIIFLTAKTMEGDIVEGLGLGGDDYITKPFGIKEIRARVNAHIRRDKRERTSGIDVSGVFFNLRGNEAFVDDEKIEFTKGEYSICCFLAKNKGQVFSKERIYEKVFGYDGESDSSCITEHVKNIRRKLKKFGINTIETVWGIGYKWI